MMRGRAPDDQGNTDGDGEDLLANMIEVLQQNADNPPAELAGVPNSFLDELDRVPKKSLKATDSCPICRNAFLDGKSGRVLAKVRVCRLTRMADRRVPACRGATVSQRPSVRSRLHSSLAETQLHMSA
jgi:hypothetical protein